MKITTTFLGKNKIKIISSDEIEEENKITKKKKNVIQTFKRKRWSKKEENRLITWAMMENIVVSVAYTASRQILNYGK